MPSKRQSGETDQEFISRCMSETKDEYPDQAQRYAVCKTYSEKMVKEKKQEELFVLQPRKTENRGAYLTRCSKHPKIKAQMGNLKERMAYCLTSFGEYYKYWSKLEDFAEVPKDSALGACITKEKAKGFDYKTAYNHCATKVVAKSGTITLAEDDLLVEPVEFGEMSVLGYNTKYFHICPGAQATFEHLISMNPDEETQGMIRSAAQIADNVFRIEAEVIDAEVATPEQINEAELLVDDFYDLIHEIDEELGMLHDVSYMDGHIEKIASYLK